MRTSQTNPAPGNSLETGSIFENGWEPTAALIAIHAPTLCAHQEEIGDISVTQVGEKSALVGLAERPSETLRKVPQNAITFAIKNDSYAQVGL